MSGHKSAFPLHVPYHKTHLGISQRGYLAAHAPEMPDWWEFSEQPPKARSTYLEAYLPALGLTNGECQVALDWWRDPCWELDDNLRNKIGPALEMVEEQSAKNRADSIAYRLRRMTAWRWAYADAMLAEVAE